MVRRSYGAWPRRPQFGHRPQAVDHALFFGATPKLAEFPENQLLGIKNLLERGQFPKSQFIDLVNQPEAPIFLESEAPSAPSMEPAQEPDSGAMNAAQLWRVQEPETPPGEAAALPSADGSNTAVPPENSETVPTPPVVEGSTYGPVRRVTQKTRPSDLVLGIPETQPEDFLEMLQEVVPRLIRDSPGWTCAGHRS